MVSDDARLDWWYLHVDEETYAQCLAPFTREELTGAPDMSEESPHLSKLPSTPPQATVRERVRRMRRGTEVNVCASLLHRWKYLLFCLI